MAISFLQPRDFKETPQHYPISALGAAHFYCGEASQSGADDVSALAVAHRASENWLSSRHMMTPLVVADLDLRGNEFSVQVSET